MTSYIQWISTTENESKYQRRQPHPWEVKDLERPVIPNPTVSTQRRTPSWMQKPVQKQTTLKDVDGALLDYENSRQKQNLEKLRDTLMDWGDSDGFKEMIAVPSRKQAVEPALAEIKDWLKAEFRMWENIEHHDVLVNFSQAARSILHKFPMIPELYRSALQETFIKSETGSDPLYCMKWYKSTSDWELRVKQLGDTSNAASSADAFTVTWTKENPLRVTKHKQWSEPFNRAVEFVKVDPGVFTHELLHWCTHENFKSYVETKFVRRSEEYNFLKEALTEWLKRYATGDANAGGYPWEYREAVEVTGYAKISEIDVGDAYLAGNQVEQVIVRLLQAKSEYEKAKTLKCDRASYNRVLEFFAAKSAGPSMKIPHRDANLTENMFRGFREDGLNADDIRKKTNQAWADAYLKL